MMISNATALMNLRAMHVNTLDISLAAQYPASSGLDSITSRNPSLIHCALVHHTTCHLTDLNKPSMNTKHPMPNESKCTNTSGLSVSSAAYAHTHARAQ
jgi:hypothetical protein